MSRNDAVTQKSDAMHDETRYQADEQRADDDQQIGLFHSAKSPLLSMLSGYTRGRLGAVLPAPTFSE